MLTVPFQQPAARKGWQRRTAGRDTQCRHQLDSQTLPTEADGQRGLESHDKFTAVLGQHLSPLLFHACLLLGCPSLEAFWGECSPVCPCHTWALVLSPGAPWLGHCLSCPPCPRHRVRASGHGAPSTPRRPHSRFPVTAQPLGWGTVRPVLTPVELGELQALEPHE